MTVRVYRSTDAGAPVLTGQVGSLVALLDACLVNGYGAGAHPAAGWTKPLAAANKGAYLQNTAASNNPAGMLLYVDDTGPGAGAAREARICGFETMSAITPTGTGQFPTAAQSLIGTGMLVVRKSATADATARQWTLIANGQTLYLFTETGDATAPFAACGIMFGDLKAFKANDQYAVMIMARQVENSGSQQADPFHALGLSNAPTMTTLNTSLPGHYMARTWTGLGSSVKVTKLPPNYLSIVSSSGFSIVGQYVSETSVQFSTTNAANVAMGRNAMSTQWPTPNGPDGSIELEPVYIGHSWARRGYLPGLWYTLMDRPFGHNDTFTVAAGPLNGKSFLAQMIQAYIASSGDQGQAIIETSDTWG